MTDGTLQALVATANVCWHPPASASVARRGSARPPGHETVAEFLVVPSAARPRLLVPAGAAAAAAESVRRYSHALPPAERLVRTVLTAGLRSGVLDVLVPDRLRVEVARADRERVESLQAWIGELLGEPVLLSLGVGTPRANRKPVLQAISRRGRALAFVKLGDTELTRALLRCEGAALQRLAQRPPAGLAVPRLLHLGEWHGIDVLVQSALATPPWTRPRRGDLPLDAMRALVASFDGGRRPAVATAMWERVAAAPARLADQARRELFEQVTQRTADRVGTGRELVIGAWHGDWAPWNMAWVGSQVRLWDWERFAEDVPAGFDPAHWVLSVQTRRLGWRPALAGLGEAARAVLPGVGVRPSEVDDVLLLYLVELCRRYLRAACTPTGGPLRAQADVLLEHLARVTIDPARDPVLPEWSVP